ncbi:MAG: NAD(P)/FAD-dependent oxidoreductase [Planctomycetota bacterium]|jgi:thioredoxin reductase (NADPH)
MTDEGATFDVAVIGSGMAGLTAAIYCLRFKLKTCVFSRELGGIITESALVENWPGETAISGLDLMERVRGHAESLGAAMIFTEVASVGGSAGHFTLETSDGKSKKVRAVILALGSKRRKLGVPGEAEFAGRGVSYCATCDAFFFRGKTVAVVGGSDSAAASAELLARMAEKVYILYRREKLRAEPIRVERLEGAANVEVLTNTKVREIVGEEKVSAVVLEDGGRLAVDGVFVEVGFEPATEMAAKAGVRLDESGFIATDEGCRSSVAGIYAAGDVTTGSNRLRQLVTAAAEGAIAAESLFEDLTKSPLQY